MIQLAILMIAKMLLVAVILSLPAYLLMNFFWRLNLKRHPLLQDRIEALDWPRPGNSHLWRLKHQWRIAIYGPPKQGTLPDAAWLAFRGLQRLYALTVPMTYVILAMLFIGIIPTMLIPLLAAGAWVLIRTPDWPEAARKTA